MCVSEDFVAWQNCNYGSCKTELKNMLLRRDEIVYIFKYNCEVQGAIIESSC